jgi:hypothetical protein
MNLMHVKLRTGEDILCQVEDLSGKYKVIAPVQININPVNGIFVRDWLLYSEDNFVFIDKADIYFCNVASEKAMMYYEEYLYQQVEEPDEELSDLEELFMTMMESKEFIKH